MMADAASEYVFGVSSRAADPRTPSSGVSKG